MTPPIPKRRFRRRQRPKRTDPPDDSVVAEGGSLLSPGNSAATVAFGRDNNDDDRMRRRRLRVLESSGDRWTNEDRTYDRRSNDDLESVSVEGDAAEPTTVGTTENNDPGAVEENGEGGRATNESEETSQNADTAEGDGTTIATTTAETAGETMTTTSFSTDGVAQYGEGGYPTLISCASAVEASAIAAAGDDEELIEAARRAVHPLEVTFAYQLYYDDAVLASESDLESALATLEGQFLKSLAEEAGLLPLSDGGDAGAPLDCAEFLELGDGDGGRRRSRFRRRSLRKRRRGTEISDIESAWIVGVDDSSESQRDRLDEAHDCLPVDEDISGFACAPILGSVLIEMIGTNEAGVETNVGSFARSWMADYESNYSDEAANAGVERLVFLGVARSEKPGVGKSGVGPSIPSTGDSAVSAFIKGLTGGEDGDDSTPSDLGIAFAFFLCLALALLVALGTWRVVRGRRERKRKDLVELGNEGGILGLNEEDKDGIALEKAGTGVTELDNFSDETAGQPSGQPARAPEHGGDEHESCGGSSSSSGGGELVVPPIFCASALATADDDSKDEIELVLSQDEVGLANSCSSISMGRHGSGDESERAEEKAPRFTVICDELSLDESEE